MRRAFFRSPTGIIGLALLVVLILGAILGPIIWGDKAQHLDVLAFSQGPSHAHLLGTDSLGRDIFARVMSATRLTLVVSTVTAALGAVIGIPIGVGAAIAPRLLRTVLLRVIDSMIAFPALLIAIFVGAVLGPSTRSAAIGVAIGLSFSFARVASTLALSIAGREHIAATHVLGLRPTTRILRHVLPNIGETLVIATTVSISSSIVAISSLSFLGLGTQPPSIDWGSMLTVGMTAFYTNAAAALGPAVAIAFSALVFGLVGEAAARAMNPLLWSEVQPVMRASLLGSLGRAAARRLQKRGQAPAPAAPALSVGEQAAAGGNEPGRPTEAPVLEVRDLVVSFPGPHGPYPVVDRVSFSVGYGERLGIVGESGSGKTMTAMAISQLVPHPGIVTGRIRLDGRELLNGHHAKANGNGHANGNGNGNGNGKATGKVGPFLGMHLGIVFQDPSSSLNPALRIKTQLVEGARRIQHLDRAAAQEVALRRLDEVRLPTPQLQLAKHPHELSGGMRQRVMLAMSLMNQPTLLLADEPTTALDVTIQAQIMDLFQEINEHHHTAIVLVSHNLALISQNVDRVLVMYAGCVVEDITVSRLATQPRHPYTRGLLASLPDLQQPKDAPLVQIPGAPADPRNRPTGCAFQDRCPLVTDRCRVEVPPLVRAADGDAVACWVTSEE